MRRLFFLLLPLLLISLGTISCAAARVQPAESLPGAAAPTSKGTAVPGPAARRASATPLPPTATASPTAAITLPAPDLSTAPGPDIPKEHYIRSIRGHKQYFSLGCETAAARDWANYFGKDFNEFEFQYKLPLSDNPDFGFVGDVNAPWGQVPPYGYGVHAGPVADLLNQYGIPARAYKNYTLEQILARLAADKPVIAWVIGNVVGGVPYEYTDKEGRKVTVAAYEHVIIVTGYNEQKLRYMTNGKFFEVPKGVFLNSWGVLGNMVVVDE